MLLQLREMLKPTACTSLVMIAVLGACATDEVADESDTEGPLSASERESLAASIRAQFAARNIKAIPAVTVGGTWKRQAALVKLGQALIFDKVLSDNREISCMTCHPPAVGTDDDRHLSRGVRGTGLGFSRVTGVDIARNAPPLFNLQAMDAMFWDGRVEKLPDGTYRTPAGAQLTPAMTAVFEFGAVSALAMFPVTNRDEMREHVLDGNGDDLTAIADGDFTGIWEGLMKRLRAIPGYRDLFAEAYPDWPGTRTNKIDTMTFAHASNAIAAFMVSKFNLKDTPWDDFIAGDNMAFKIVEDMTLNFPPKMSERDVLRGANKFLQTCANCHNGPSLTNGRFHNTALAQIGPGVGDGDSLRDDFGRARVDSSAATARCGLPNSGASCRYAFRTSPLRNVALTAPYGHAGEIGRFGNDPDFGRDVRADLADLRAFVAHYSVNPAANLRSYDVSQLESRLQPTLLASQDSIIANIDPLFANGSPIADADVDSLTAFMFALTSKQLIGVGTTTDDSARFALCGVIPTSVPSGLSLDADPLDEDDCIGDGKPNDGWKTSF